MDPNATMNDGGSVVNVALQGHQDQPSTFHAPEPTRRWEMERWEIGKLGNWEIIHLLMHVAGRKDLVRAINRYEESTSSNRNKRGA